MLLCEYAIIVIEDCDKEIDCRRCPLYEDWANIEKRNRVCHTKLNPYFYYRFYYRLSKFEKTYYACEMLNFINEKIDEIKEKEGK